MQYLQLLRPRRPHHMRRQTTKIAHQLPCSPADTAHRRQNHHETVQNCHPSIDDLQQNTGVRAKSAPEKNSRVPRPLARLTYPDRQRSSPQEPEQNRTKSNKPEQIRTKPIAADRYRSPINSLDRPAPFPRESPSSGSVPRWTRNSTLVQHRTGPDTTAQHRTPPNMTEHGRTRPTGVGHPIRPLTPALATSDAQTDAERRSSRRPCRRTGYPAVPQPRHHHLRSTARLARSPASPAR